MKVKNLAILGSTGSIGVNALDVVRRLNREDGGRPIRQAGTAPSGGRPIRQAGTAPSGGRYRVWGLSAHSNVPLVQRQIEEFDPKVVVLGDAAAARGLKDWASRRRPGLQVWEGTEGLERLAARREVDLVLSSVVGSVGLTPLLAALRAGKKVALANKEALIVAGDLLMETARRSGAEIIPVDSEHSAIFQCLGASDGRRAGSLRRIILTASGGAFYRRRGSLDKVTVSEALDHPTWKMGRKITIDCATLTNKGLEAIEAHHLFGVPMDDIQIVVHPQSIVHSLVEFADGALLAQLSHPDMRLPIQYALTYPERRPAGVRPLSLEEIRTLEFFRPDFRRFPCLGLALEAGRRGGSWPAAFNGANEAAVRAFLDERISFLGIPKLLARVMEDYGKEMRSADFGTQNGSGKPNSELRTPHSAIGLEDILAVDRWARRRVEEILAAKPAQRRELVL